MEMGQPLHAALPEMLSHSVHKHQCLFDETVTQFIPTQPTAAEVLPAQSVATCMWAE
jgi:hypothetical protein